MRLIQSWCAALPAKYEIAPERQQVHGPHRSGSGLEDQAIARLRILNRIEKQVRLVQRLAGEENLGHEPVHPTRTEHRKMDVRWTPPPVRFGHRISPWLDGEKPVPALLIRHNTAFAGEVGINRSLVAVHFMNVLAGRIGLPDFD